MSLPDTVRLPGVTLDFEFPTAMFAVDGKMLHRVHRTKALKQFAETYDNIAEVIRLECIKRNPEGEYPPLEKLGMALFEVQVAKGGDDTIQIEGTDEGGVLGSVGTEDEAGRGKVGKRNPRPKVSYRARHKSVKANNKKR